MITVKNIQVFNLENTIIGMRNAMNSWDRSDSKWEPKEGSSSDNLNDSEMIFKVGQNDLKLMHNLIHSGHPHDKFMRQVLCSMQITAPLYWWKEMDTYKVATVANSTSTMHKLHSKPIKETDLSLDLPLEIPLGDKENIKTFTKDFIDYLEWLRQKYLETKDVMPKDNPYWRTLIQLLPSSYNQTRMWTANYATLREIYMWRKNHKLVEWRQFCELFTDDNLFPYGKELITYELD
jgi:hypothetical protein